MKFPRSLLGGQSLDFSFSGLKTAVLYHVNGVPGAIRNKGSARRAPACNKRQAYGIENYSEQEVADIAASFQAAVVDVLRIKLRRAAKLTGAKTLIIGGGVSANSALRESAGNLADQLGCTLRQPELRFCVDNAAMIAGIGYHYFRAGMIADLTLAANPTVRR